MREELDYDNDLEVITQNAVTGLCFQCERDTVYVCGLCPSGTRVCPRCWDLHERTVHAITEEQE